MIGSTPVIENVKPSVAKRLLSRAVYLLDRLAEALERSAIWPVLLFLAIYLPITIFLAQRKLIWDDEFFTLYLSRPGSMGEILRAMQTGADQHPPFFYYLTHQIMAVFGMSHVTLRLSAIVGYGLTCICLFYLLRSRTSVLWAALGMFLPLVTRGYYYASEARGYGLMLGFCALALLAWQNAASPQRRSVWLYVLFGALAGAVSSHYYAVLFLVPLCIGELTRTYLLKRLDIPVWLSFCGAGVPLVAFFSIIQHASDYSAHFWAKPTWGNVLNFYPSFLGVVVNVFLVGCSLYLLGRHQFIPYDEAGTQKSGLFIWETVASVSIVALPLMVMVLAKTVTKGYTERYAIPALIGAVLVLCHFGFSTARQSRILPLLLSLICLPYFAVQGIQMLKDQGVALSDIVNDMTLLGSHTASPTAVAEVTVFHRVSFYAPRQFVQNLTYVADPEESVKYIRHDTIDRGLMDLRPWFPLKVISREKYFFENPQFLVYGYIGPWSWLSYDLTPPDYETKLLERQSNQVLFAVRRITPVAGSSNNQDASNEDLFRDMSTEGPSLCSQWMPGDAFCATVERERIKGIERGLTREKSR